MFRFRHIYSLLMLVASSISFATSANAQTYLYTSSINTSAGSSTDGNASAVTINTYSFTSNSSTLVGSTVLPTTVSGSNRQLTLSNTANSEGALTRSVNGQYLVIGGYDAAPGTTGVVSTLSSSTNRIVGRININTNGSLGTVDTSTRISDGYSANNIRSVATDNGQNFYTGGNGSSTTGGVRYVGFGGTGVSTQISNTTANIRVVNIFNNQVYASSGAGSNVGVNTVGSGKPTTSGQTTTLVSGIASTNAYDFYQANDNTFYVANSNASTTASNGGGLQKYTFNGTSYALSSLSFTGVTSFTGLTGLTGQLENNQLVMYGVTPTQLLKFVDNGTGTVNVTALATAAANTAFRGVELTPAPPALVSLLLGSCATGFTAWQRRRKQAKQSADGDGSETAAAAGVAA